MDLRREIWTRAPPPPRPRYNFLHSHTVFGKFWPNNRLIPPLGMTPPLKNPGSGAGHVTERWEVVADSRRRGAPTNEFLFNFMSFFHKKHSTGSTPWGGNL